MQSPTPLFDSLPVEFRNNHETFNQITNGNFNSQNIRINGSSRNEMNQKVSPAAVAAAAIPDQINNTDGYRTSDFTVSCESSYFTLESATKLDSLNCDELLDLYHITKINFLDAKDRLINEGFQSREIYQELDYVQKQLGYKCDHYYDELLDAARVNPDVLKKLRDLADIKRNRPIVNKLNTVTKEAQEQQEANSESESDIELIGHGDSMDNTFDVSDFENPGIQAIANGEQNQEVRSKDGSSSLEKDSNGQGIGPKAPKEVIADQGPVPNGKEHLDNLKTNFASIIEKVNIHQIKSEEAVYLFKQSLPVLKFFKDPERLLDLVKSSIMSISKETYGTEYDIRYDLVNNLIKSLSKDAGLFKSLSGDNKILKRITNWLRFDLSKNASKNIGGCLLLIEKLPLTLTKIRELKLDAVISYTIKHQPEFKELCNRILVQSSNLEEKVLKPAAITATPDQSSPSEAPPTSLNAPSSTEPQAHPKPEVKIKKSVGSAFSRRPSSTSNERQASAVTQLPVQNDPKLVNSGPNDTAALTPKHVSQNIADTNNSAASRPNPPARKWSLNNYLTGKRKVSGSEASSKSSVGSPSSSLSAAPGSSKKSSGILKVLTDAERNSPKRPKKSVRFAANLAHVKLIESHFNQNFGGRERAKDMESSEAQALIRENKEAATPIMIIPSVPKTGIIQNIDHGEVKEFVFHPWISLRSLELVEDCDDASVTRGGTREVEPYIDLKVPDLSSSNKVQTNSPYEPSGLVVEDIDDNFEIPDVSENISAGDGNKTVEAIPDKHDDNLETSHGFDESPNLEQNANHDQEVLDLLDDDKMLDGYDNNEKEEEAEEDEEENQEGKNEKNEGVVENNEVEDKEKAQPGSQSDENNNFEKLDSLDNDNNNEEEGEKEETEADINNNEVKDEEIAQPESQSDENNNNEKLDLLDDDNNNEEEEEKQETEADTRNNEVEDEEIAQPEFQSENNNNEKLDLLDDNNISEKEEKEEVKEANIENNKVEDKVDTEKEVGLTQTPTVIPLLNKVDHGRTVPEPTFEVRSSDAPIVIDDKVDNTFKSNLEDHVEGQNENVDHESQTAAFEGNTGITIKSKVPERINSPQSSQSKHEELFKSLKKLNLISNKSDSTPNPAAKTETQNYSPTGDANQFQDNSRKANESPRLRESITIEDLMSRANPGSIPRTLYPNVSTDKIQQANGQSKDAHALLPSVNLEDGKETALNFSTQNDNDSTRPRSSGSDGQPRILKIKGAALRDRSCSPPKPDASVNNKRPLENGAPQNHSRKLSSTDKVNKVDHGSSRSSRHGYERYSPRGGSSYVNPNIQSPQERISKDELFPGKPVVPESKNATKESELFPGKPMVSNSNNFVKKRDELFPENRGRILPTSPRRKEISSKAGGPLFHRVSKPVGPGNSISRRIHSTEYHTGEVPDVETIMELRSKDVRSYVRKLPEIKLHKYGIVCANYPRCKYAAVCNFIHLSEKAPARERH